MNEAELDARLMKLQDAAEIRGAGIVVQRGKPATDAQIELCQEAVGTLLPPSLAAFLRERNGLVIHFYANRHMVSDAPERWNDIFEVADTTSIATLTMEMQEFFEMVAKGPRAPVSTRAAGRSIIVLSNEFDLVTYLAIDRVDAAGKFPVMQFNQEYHDDWLDAPGPPIAASVDEYVRKSLDHMTYTGDSFMYWDRAPEHGV